MGGTSALITTALFIAMGGIAGVVCLIGERRLRRKQQDWSAEGNARGIR